MVGDALVAGVDEERRKEGVHVASPSPKHTHACMYVREGGGKREGEEERGEKGRAHQ